MYMGPINISLQCIRTCMLMYNYTFRKYFNIENNQKYGIKLMRMLTIGHDKYIICWIRRISGVCWIIYNYIIVITPDIMCFIRIK